MEPWQEKLRALLPRFRSGRVAEDKRKIGIPKHATQYGDRTESERLQLVIGLDFGTAFTKVVIAERRRAYAVPFNDHSERGNPYLLPDVLTVNEDGHVQLGHVAGGRQFSNLKMPILRGDATPEDLGVVTAYLALVLQEARSWFMNKHQGAYSRFSLDWNINIGLPSVHYQNNVLVDTYRGLVQAAWVASTQAGAVTLAQDNHSDGDGQELPEHAVGAFPEFAAQINGYVRSAMRRSDLHMLMDVGAGTVDMAVFNVHQKEGDDVFPIFSSRVKSLGVRMLQQHRIQELNKQLDPVSLDGASDAQVRKALRVTSRILKEVDQPFRSQIAWQARDVVKLAKLKYPGSARWQDGVTFFLCGGGAKVDFYKQLVQQMDNTGIPCPLDRLSILTPDRLEAPGISRDEYDRLSVAYGLSFDQFEIGEITPANQIENIDNSDASELVGGAICSACKGTGGAMANSCRRCGGSGWIP